MIDRGFVVARTAIVRQFYVDRDPRNVSPTYETMDLDNKRHRLREGDRSNLTVFKNDGRTARGFIDSIARITSLLTIGPLAPGIFAGDGRHKKSGRRADSSNDS